MQPAGLPDCGKPTDGPQGSQGHLCQGIGRGQRFASSPGSETEKALNGSNFLEPLSMTNARLREGRLRDLGNIIARLPGIERRLGHLR